MANPFDQFDTPAAAAPRANPFDQFDAPAAPAAVAAAPEERGAVVPKITQMATGFNEGFASSVLRPLDVIPFFASKALGGEGVHPFEGTFRKYFVEPTGEPQGRLEETLRRGGQMVGENLPLMVMGAGAAGAGVRSGVTSAEQVGGSVVNKIRGAADSVLEGMAANPVKSAVGENVGALVSGAGGNVAKNVAKDSGGSQQQQDAAETFGQILTPSAAAAYSKVSPTRLAAKGAKFAADKVIDTIPEAAVPESFRPTGGTYAERKAEQLAYSNREGKYANPDEPRPPEGNYATRRMDAAQAKREGVAAEAASKEFKQIIDQPDAAGNLAEAERLTESVPGFKPGVAKATQDPALLKLQQTMEGRATGDELRGVQKAYDENVQAIRDAKDNIVPVQGENPQDAVAAANAARVNRVNEGIDQRAEGVRGQIRAQSEALPEIDRAAAGQTLRDIRGGEQAAADAEVQRLRGAIANPETPIRVGDQEMTVNQALDRRAAINQEVRRYASANTRTVDDVRQIEALSAERDALDGALERVNLPGMQEYTNYYRNEYAPRFLEGPSRDVGRYSQTGIDKNRVQAEDVPSAFFKPNNVSEARQFNRLYGEGTAPETTAARQAMTDYALDDLRHSVVDANTGLIKEGAVNRWLQKNERVLNEMPWIREAVNARNPDELYSRLGQLEQRQRQVADTKVAGLLGKNPEQHIDAALNDWQVMRGLRSSVRGDPQAEAALRRAVIDRAPDPMAPHNEFEAWLKGNDRALRQVLEPTHLKALQDILSAAKITSQLPRPTGTVDLPGSLADKSAKRFGITVPSLLQRALSVKQGRMSAEYGVADVATRVFRQFSNAEIENAWKEALYNPKVAKDLQVMVKGGGATPIQMARMRNYLLSVGLQDAEERSQRK